MPQIIFNPIGIIHTPFINRDKIPIQGLLLGWLTGKDEQFSRKKSDGRFKDPSAFLKE